MVAVALLALWLPSVGCGPGTDSDVVRSERQEGSTPARAGTGPAAPVSTDAAERGRIVFIGTSLTVGHGLDDQSVRFTDRIQVKVDSAGLPFGIVNAGVGGDTSAGGLRRIGWLLRVPMRVLVIELEANDGLRGLPVEAMRRNLQAVMDSTRIRYPDVRLVLSGMEAPPNLGPEYASAFRSVFGELARENAAVLIPFLLDGVAGRPELNQVDGIHPTVEGHGLVSETVWAYLEPVLRDVAAGGADRP
jgi:acyl-CoA thioesterase-1